MLAATWLNFSIVVSRNDECEGGEGELRLQAIATMDWLLDTKSSTLIESKESKESKESTKAKSRRMKIPTHNRAMRGG